MIAGCEHRLGFGIPNDEAEHATQVVDHVFTPVVVAHDDRLTIALGVELQASSAKFFTQLDVVVNFAVKGEGVPLWVIFWSPAKWLVGVLKVDDGKTVETEGRIFVMPGAGGIWATVAHALKGLLKGVYVLGRIVVSGQ
ncbi:hypothetical protein U2A4042370028 [Corynebacterium striatum]|nr:hypothetical protein U2A4042370028 [Corynebacterium striatum]